MVLDRLARWAPLSGTIAVGLIVAGWVLMAYFSYYPDAERALEIVTPNRSDFSVVPCSSAYTRGSSFSGSPVVLAPQCARAARMTRTSR